MVAYERHNARLSSPVALRARFHKDTQFYDPDAIDRVEIWKHAETEAEGGVLVDTVDGANVLNDSVGHYRLLWDGYDQCPPSPASPNPVGTVDGPGSPDQEGLDKIEANVTYYDKWFYRQEAGCEFINTVGLRFFLYPDHWFVDSGFDKFRFDMKPDRTQLVKGEILDIRLRIIPIPLYVATRDPITNYLIPLCQMRYRWLDMQNNEMVAWADAVFTGREGIVPTQALSASPIGSYLLQSLLILPNGQEIRYRKLPFQLLD